MPFTIDQALQWLNVHADLIEDLLEEWYDDASDVEEPIDDEADECLTQVE